MRRPCYLLIATCISLVWGAQAFAADPTAAPAAKAAPKEAATAKVLPGKALIEKSCVGCHKDEIYTSKARKITDAKALNAAVAKCSDAAKTQWTDKQKEEVVSYLNHTFYKFK